MPPMQLAFVLASPQPVSAFMKADRGEPKARDVTSYLVEYPAKPLVPKRLNQPRCASHTRHVSFTGHYFVLPLSQPQHSRCHFLEL
jgi:hypothetical protein